MNIKCPNPGCASVVPYDERLAGQRIKCAGCGHTFLVPPRAEGGVAVATTAMPPPPRPAGVAPATGPSTVAPQPPAPPAAASAPGAPEKLQKEAVAKVVQGAIAIVACILLQYVVDMLPGTDVLLGRAPIAAWIQTALAIAILVVMLRLLAPLRAIFSYYIGLMFRVSTALAGERQLHSQVSSLGLYVVLIAYLAILYQWVIRWVLGFLRMLMGSTTQLEKIIKLAFAVIGVIVVVKVILAVRPLAARLTKTITDRTVELTEKVDSKLCASCGVRMDRAMRFCPSCGKES